MVKKRGLPRERGLNALLDIKDAQAQTQITETDSVSITQIPVKALQRGKYQPRRDIAKEALIELADSIKKHGVMQPIVVRPLTQSTAQSTHITHEIIAGERRWRAAILAELTDIPAIVRPLSDEQAIALALIENIQREDLSPIEQAYALQRFHQEFNMSHSEIAEAVGKARATVSNLLRLLSLHDEVKNLLDQGQLDMGHARALLALSTGQQPIIAKQVIQKQLTVRETESLVKNLLEPTAKSAKPANPDITKLNQLLSDSIGAKVKVQQSKEGKGKLIIHYFSHDEFDGIVNRLAEKFN